MLIDIVKQIVTQNGEQILLDPKRVNAFLRDLAKDEPKPLKLAFIECLEHGAVKILEDVAEEERVNCKGAIAQRLHIEEGRDIEQYRNALDILSDVLFGYVPDSIPNNVVTEMVEKTATTEYQDTIKTAESTKKSKTSTNKYHNYYNIAKEAYDGCLEAKNEIFISYSNKDNRFAKELVTYLETLKESDGIVTWHFPYIEGRCKKISHEIGRHLRKAKVVIQLASWDYIHSPYIRIVERPMINNAIENDGLERILLLVGECELDDFEEFFDKPIFNGGHTPLNNTRKYPPAERGKVYKKITKECKSIFGV